MNQSLPTAVLGRTGLEVTRLGFGTALHGPSRPTMSLEHVRRLYEGVLDAGINFIDTSHDYVDSEEMIGRLVSSRYSECYLATKSGCTASDGVQDNSNHVWTRENLLRGVEVSLERLGRESVDIMQLHNPTLEECEAGELVDALEEMRSRGLVRFIGVSTTLPHLPTFLQWGAFDVFQIPYSALEPKHDEWITRAGEAGIGIVIRGGIAQGEPNVGLGTADRWEGFRRGGLDEILEEGEGRSAFVLRYTLSHPHVHTVIVDTTNLDHVAENVKATLRGPLPPDVYAEAKRRLSGGAAHA